MTVGLRDIYELVDNGRFRGFAVVLSKRVERRLPIEEVICRGSEGTLADVHVRAGGKTFHYTDIERYER